MAKFPFARPYVLRRHHEALQVEVERIRADNDRLRESLAAAQKAKETAVKQADELRKEKERLRLRVASLKKSMDQMGRNAESLQLKISALREANEEFERQRSGSPLPSGGEGQG